MRQAFLMSGVPEALRKQAQVQAISAAASDVSWPTATQCHVQQRGESNVWDMTQLSLREHQIPPFIPPQHNLDSALYQKQTSTKVNLERRPQLSAEAVQLVLAEIASSNPAYPAKRVLAQLQARRDTALPQSMQCFVDSHVFFV